MNNPLEFDKMEAKNAHYLLQTGAYFSSIHDLRGAQATFSDKVPDFIWNHAARISVSPDEVSGLIERVIHFYVEHDRLPCLYLSPMTRPTDLGQELVNRGFEVQDEEAWMFYVAGRPAPVETPPGFRIELIERQEQMKAFVRVFNEAYEDIDPGYGEALEREFQATRPRQKVIHHYLGLLGNEAVGVASLYSSGRYGGIYNVGTVPEHRRRGIGSSLTLRAVDDSFSLGTNVIFLQAEKGTDVERLYSHLGFTTSFVRQGYVLSQENSPEDRQEG